MAKELKDRVVENISIAEISKKNRFIFLRYQLCLHQMISKILKLIFRGTKACVLTFMILFYFNSRLFSQEVDDISLSSKGIISNEYLKVNRNTIYKFEEVRYISKDSCPDIHTYSMYEIFNKCPCSLSIASKYIRNKTRWISVNDEIIVEIGKFNRGKRKLRKRYPKMVRPIGKWTFYNRNEE